jgi:hypothetical protein
LSCCASQKEIEEARLQERLRIERLIGMDSPLDPAIEALEGRAKKLQGEEEKELRALAGQLRDLRGELLIDGRPSCTAAYCDRPPAASVLVDGDWHRYCQECARALERTGKRVLRWDRSAGTISKPTATEAEIRERLTSEATKERLVELLRDEGWTYLTPNSVANLFDLLVRAAALTSAFGEGGGEENRRWVKQRRTDDCLWACVASILGLDPLRGARWREPLAAPTPEVWDPVLAQHGYALVVAPPHVSTRSRALWILCVPSLHDPGDGHCVVMRGRELVWDPGSREPRYDQERVDVELAGATGAGNGKSAILLLPLHPAPAPEGSE